MPDFYTLEERQKGKFHREHVVPAFLGGRETVPVLEAVNRKYQEELDAPLLEDLGILDARHSRKRNRPSRWATSKPTTRRNFVSFQAGR
ncbi:MAG: hypothetical protein AAFX94_05900 [Myxococcota bacterium]